MRLELLLIGAMARGKEGPALSFAPSTTNLNSLSSRAVVASGIDGLWVKSLGRTVDLESCGTRCADYNSAGSKCRSFTRYVSSYSNRSLAGMCFGHLDPVVYLLPTDAADSGEVRWPCEEDADCSLNGACMLPNGLCKCFSGWTGRRCEQLHFEPVERDQLGFSPVTSNDEKNMSSWGGSVQQRDGVWNMFVVEMVNHCGIAAYLMNSAVVYATANAVGGPYRKVDQLLVPFTHEPDVVIAPTGELVMVTVHGSLSDTRSWDGKPYQSCNCTPGSPHFPPGATTPDCVTCNNSCVANAKPTLSIARDPAGPWRSRDLWNDPSVRGENPSIWITDAGEIYGMGRGGNMVLYGSDWQNSGTYVRGTKSGVTSTLSSKPDVEDPFLYQDGNGHFHALFHSLEGPHMVGGVNGALVGTHAYSFDAVRWYYTGTAYTNRVNFTDGTHMLLNRRERPHLVFSEGTRTPVALSNSAEIGGKYGDRSFTLIQPIKNKG